jgi:hypothetical protein
MEVPYKGGHSVTERLCWLITWSLTELGYLSAYGFCLWYCSSITTMGHTNGSYQQRSDPHERFSGPFHSCHFQDLLPFRSYPFHPLHPTHGSDWSILSSMTPPLPPPPTHSFPNLAMSTRNRTRLHGVIIIDTDEKITLYITIIIFMNLYTLFG